MILLFLVLLARPRQGRAYSRVPVTQAAGDARDAEREFLIVFGAYCVALVGIAVLGLSLMASR